MVSIFQQPWWLDAATDGDWSMVESAPRSGLRASLPIYVERHRFGLQKICMPPLTRTLGPIFTEVPGAPRASATTRMRARLQIMEDLIARLPRHVIFQQFFGPDASELLAFLLKGYEVGVSYTFRITDCADHDAVWRRMRDKTRNVIRRAGERFEVADGLSGTAFSSFYSANIARRNLRPFYAPQRIAALVEAAMRRAAGTVLYCAGGDGVPVAAIFVVWDEAHLYYLMSSRDERRADNGAVSLLLWRAIQLAGARGLDFDFDGFHLEGGAIFATQFGGEMVPRWKISYAVPLVRLRWSLRGALAQLRPARLGLRMPALARAVARQSAAAP